jgi:hypothetical protein
MVDDGPPVVSQARGAWTIGFLREPESGGDVHGQT